MPGCCESGLCAEEGGTRFNLFGINILGIGTLVDSLWVLKQLVFDSGDTSLHDLKAQLNANWPDSEILQRCRQLAGKFGSDSPGTNALAAEFADHIADLVLEQPLEHGVQPYPGLFIFTGWAQMNLSATPDGRQDADPISYGVGPSTLCTGRTPTSTLKSSALTANDRCGCGNPMFLTLNRNDIAGTAGRTRLRHLIETYFRQGGYHIHVNILDAAQLREAQADPGGHADLLVRISGLSAQFVALDQRLQNALIARVEQGI
jgi:formate C-acetyltransferase